jgi:hypothetical protein
MYEGLEELSKHFKLEIAKQTFEMNKLSKHGYYDAS